MRWPSIRTFAASVMLSLAAVMGWCQEAGTVKSSSGSAELVRGSGKMPATVGMKVQVGDLLVTGADGRAAVTMLDNTQMSAGPNSSLRFDNFAFNAGNGTGAMKTTVNRGSLAVISGKIARASPEQVQFNTSNITLGVRGTKFVIEVKDVEP